jgi:hypothetical protein
MYTLNFAALAYTLHPPLGYFPEPCDVNCYAFIQVMISNTFLILLLTLWYFTWLIVVVLHSIIL